MVISIKRTKIYKNFHQMKEMPCQKSQKSQQQQERASNRTTIRESNKTETTSTERMRSQWQRRKVDSFSAMKEPGVVSTIKRRI